MKHSRLKNGWILVIVGLSLAVAAIQPLTASKPVSAQEDAYIQHGVTVSPSAACIGDTVTFSGSGYEMMFLVSVRMTLLDEETYGNEYVPYGASYRYFYSPTIVDFGIYPAQYGKWSLTITVPATGTNENKQIVDILPGTYSIIAYSAEFEGSFNYYETGTLEVLNCSNSDIGSMPSTGLPTGALALLAGAGLIAFTGAALGFGKFKN